jgi:hypothetical protein
MTFEGLEKFSAPRHHRCMCASIHKLEQRVRIFPDRHVDGEEWVRCCADTGRVAAFILQAPHETRACVRQRVDSIQCCKEIGSAGIALRRDQLTHVDLREVPLRNFSHA